MERLIITLSLLAFFLSCKTATPERPMPYIDERNELMNVVFRLAGIPDYQYGVVKPYTEAVDHYFAPYKEHELIGYTRQLWNQYHVSHDAVAKYAVMLHIDNGKIAFIKDGIPEFGPRWQGDVPGIFLEKLNNFYTESGFHRFFRNNTRLYNIAVERYNKGYVDTDFKWFDNYFGQKPGDKDFKVILNLLEKDWSYGPKVTFANHSKETAYAIVGMSDADSLGLPIFDEWSYHVVIHELIHSYANHTIDRHKPLFDSINEVFYNYSANRLRQTGVGNPKLFLYETLVRAGEIQYHKANSDTLLWRKRLNAEMANGFLWLETLCNLMTDEYETNRTKYPDMDSFMPRMATVLNSLSPDGLLKEFLSKAVKITSSSIPNGDKQVNPATRKLAISFDRAMQTGEKSFGLWPGKYGKNSFPKITKIGWSEDARQLIMDIRLEPGKTYSLLFLGYFFMSTDYKPIENFHLEFETSN